MFLNSDEEESYENDSEVNVEESEGSDFEESNPIEIKGDVLEGKNTMHLEYLADFFVFRERFRSEICNFC